MIEIIKFIIPYISGLWTLPWIIVGMIFTYFLSNKYGHVKIDYLMKKAGLLLLYVFIPLLLFRIFLNIDFDYHEILFSFIALLFLSFLYVFSYFTAKFFLKSYEIDDDESLCFLKTLLANQGRSSAFIGGALLAVEQWSVPAGIYMSITGIFLFAIIPYLLSLITNLTVRHNKHRQISDLPRIGSRFDNKYINYAKYGTVPDLGTNAIIQTPKIGLDKPEILQQSNMGLIHKKVDSNKVPVPLPAYLRYYPWYLMLFVISAILIHRTTGVTVSSMGDVGIVFHFITALTVPAGLYYAGSGIHPEDMNIKEIKLLFFKKIRRDLLHENTTALFSARASIIITMVMTPLTLGIVCGMLYFSGLFPFEWVAVIILNSILPITGTNMFLVPYGIDKKGTAMAVTWTTIISLPLLLILFPLFVLLT